MPLSDQMTHEQSVTIRISMVNRYSDLLSMYVKSSSASARRELQHSIDVMHYQYQYTFGTLLIEDFPQCAGTDNIPAHYGVPVEVTRD